MKSIEESKLSIELLVKHYLEENTAKTATLPGFLLMTCTFYELPMSGYMGSFTLPPPSS